MSHVHDIQIPPNVLIIKENLINARCSVFDTRFKYTKSTNQGYISFVEACEMMPVSAVALHQQFA